MTTINTSHITLESYVKILRLAEKEHLLNIEDFNELETRIVKELISEKLLSDAKKELPKLKLTFIESIVITPKGAVALVEWSNFINKSKWWYKIVDNLVRLLWILVGAICTLLPKLFT